MRAKPLSAMSAVLMILVSAILAGCVGTDPLGGEDVPEINLGDVLLLVLIT